MLIHFAFYFITLSFLFCLSLYVLFFLFKTLLVMVKWSFQTFSNTGFTKKTGVFESRTWTQKILYTCNYGINYLIQDVSHSVSQSHVEWITLTRDLTKLRGDGKENVKKTIGLMSKTTTLQIHHTFLYISLLSLHNNDMKWPHFKFTWVREWQGDKYYHLCLNSGKAPSLQLQPKFPSFK